MMNGIYRIMMAMLVVAGAHVLVPARAAAQSPAVPEAAANSDAKAISLTGGYVLGPSDVVEVQVLGREEFKPRVQVQVDGTVQLPFLGTMTASGKTVLQFGEEVKRALKGGGYYSDPVVTVTVASYASRYVVVLGEIAQPGVVPVDRAYRASELLARVGGLRESATDMLHVTRSSGEQFDLDVKTIATGGGDQDPIINPGDKIYVPKADTFYIYGQIGAPGNYKIERGMTMRQALARAGGLTPLGSEGRIKVTRDGKEIRKFSLDDPLKDKDVVVVGEKFF
jgi:polysaccharide biosynthesis/export protein